MAELEAKYPELRSYLVVASRGGQARLADSVEVMAKEFPALLEDGPEKIELLELLRREPSSDASFKERGSWQDALMGVVARLGFVGGHQVEIRFRDLCYDLVAELQLDPLVDRERTPQTRASIRIVLGTLAGFARGEAPEKSR